MDVYSGIALASIAVYLLATVFVDNRTRLATLREMANVIDMVLRTITDITMSTLSSLTQRSMTSEDRSKSKTENSPSNLTIHRSKSGLYESDDREITGLPDYCVSRKTNSNSANRSRSKSGRKTSQDQISWAENSIKTADCTADCHESSVSHGEDNGDQWNLGDDFMVISLGHGEDQDSGKKPIPDKIDTELAKYLGKSDKDLATQQDDAKCLSTASISLKDSGDQDSDREMLTPEGDTEMEDLEEFLREFTEELKQGMREWVQYCARFEGVLKTDLQRNSQIRKMRFSEDSYFKKRLEDRSTSRLSCDMDDSDEQRCSRPSKDDQLAEMIEPRQWERSMSAPTLGEKKLDIIPDLLSLRPKSTKLPKKIAPDLLLTTAATAKATTAADAKQVTSPPELEKSSSKKKSDVKKGQYEIRRPTTKEALLEELAIGMLRIFKKNQELGNTKDNSQSPGLVDKKKSTSTSRRVRPIYDIPKRSKSRSFILQTSRSSKPTMALDKRGTKSWRVSLLKSERGLVSSKGIANTSRKQEHPHHSAGVGQLSVEAAKFKGADKQNIHSNKGNLDNVKRSAVTAEKVVHVDGRGRQVQSAKIPKKATTGSSKNTGLEDIRSPNVARQKERPKSSQKQGKTSRKKTSKENRTNLHKSTKKHKSEDAKKQAKADSSKPAAREDQSLPATSRSKEMKKANSPKRGDGESGKVKKSSQQKASNKTTKITNAGSKIKQTPQAVRSEESQQKRSGSAEAAKAKTKRDAKNQRAQGTTMVKKTLSPKRKS